jgi:hypothetical protein
VELVTFDQNSNVIRVFIRDTTSATGGGLTGLDHTSSGLSIGTLANNEASVTTYTSAGSTIETITTIGTYQAPTATKCRFKAVDATNFPGWYEIHLADARFSVSGAKALDLCIKGVSNGAQVNKRIQLPTVDVFHADGGVAIRSNGLQEESIADAAITAGKIDTGAIDADAQATDAVAEIQAGLPTLAQLLAALAQTTRIIMVAPITRGTMTIVKGDAYQTSQGTQLTFTKENGETGWPSTVSTLDISFAADATLLEEDENAAGLDDISLSSVTNDGGTLQLSAAQTNGLTATTSTGRYRFWLVANRSTLPKTVRTGVLTVLEGDGN